MLQNELTQHLVDVIAEYDGAASKAKYDDLSDLPFKEVNRLTTRGQYAVERVAGANSLYARRVKAFIDDTDGALCYRMIAVFGIAKALLDDVQAGYLKSIEEVIHGDVFTDFLEMAEYLSREGYKDAAAVIAGSTLEGHLRQLCAKHSLGVSVSSKDGQKPQKADTMNSDLVKVAAYEKTDLKNVTAWLGLRNDAAHGEYAKYQSEQVQLMIAGIRDFITRVPA